MHAGVFKAQGIIYFCRLNFFDKMSLQLSEQERVRREALDKMRALGINPYPQAEYEVNLSAM